MNRLHHVAIIVRPGHTDTVVAFYEEVFGFKRIPKAEGAGRKSGAWLQISPESQLHLSERDVPGHEDAHFAILVDGLAGLLEVLASRGCEWNEQAPVFGARRGFTRDPSGNRVEILQAQVER